MRCFIAIPLPQNIIRDLSDIQSKLKQTETDIKWVNSNNIHLTLKFLGYIEDAKIGEISKNLKEAFRKSKGFESALGKPGAFPSISNPRVIWLGISKNEDKITKLQKIAEDVLEPLGFDRETRAFHPHLTLGRVRSKKNINKLIEQIKTPQTSKADPFPIEKIILFQSILKPSGAEYTALDEFEF